MKTGIDVIEQSCRARGLRMTGQRRIIARIVSESHDHPDVVELHRRIATVDPKISLSTVYRTLNLFESQGIIERLEFRGERSRFEPASQHHDHLIDLTTGKVIEFRSQDIERLQVETARKLGFHLVSHRLELYAVPIDEKEG